MVLSYTMLGVRKLESVEPWIKWSEEKILFTVSILHTSCFVFVHSFTGFDLAFAFAKTHVPDCFHNRLSCCLSVSFHKRHEAQHKYCFYQCWNIASTFSSSLVAIEFTSDTFWYTGEDICSICCLRKQKISRSFLYLIAMGQMETPIFGSTDLGLLLASFVLLCVYILYYRQRPKGYPPGTLN
jgi:hypothetical protein